MDTPDEHSVDIWLIQQYHPYNIEWTVRLTNTYTHQIFGEYPTALPIQYWMAYYTDH